jgi:hypothetical protein
MIQHATVRGPAPGLVHDGRSIGTRPLRQEHRPSPIPERTDRKL